MEVVGTVASVATLADIGGRLLDLRHHAKQAKNELRLAAYRIDQLSQNLKILTVIDDTLKNLDTGQGEAYLVLRQSVAAAMRSHALVLDMLPKNTTKQSRRSSLSWVIKDRATYEDLMKTVSSTETAVALAAMLATLLEDSNGGRWLKRDDREISATLHTIGYSGQSGTLANRQDDTLSILNNEEGAGSAIAHSSPDTTSHNCQTSHLWGICNVIRGSAFASSCNKRTIAFSIQLQLMSSLSFRMDLLMRLGFYKGGSTLSLDGGRIGIRHVVHRNHPFLLASGKGDLPAMRELLGSKQASPVMVTDGGVTPLCLSIKNGHTEAVELLLTEGADVNEPFGRKMTFALAWALKHRFPDICRMLINRGANYFDLSIYNWSPMFYLWSQARRNEDCRSRLLIKMLRERDAEFPWLHQKIVDKEGWGLMHRAAVFGTPSDVETLIESDVDAFQPFGKWNWQALHVVVDFGVHDNFLVLLPQYVKRFGMNKAKELPDSRGWTLLHIAIAKGHKEVIEGGHDKIVRTLLGLGANWEVQTLPSTDDSIPSNVRNLGCSPIRLALAYGESRYCELLRAIDDIICSQDQDEWYDADDQLWHDAVERF